MGIEIRPMGGQATAAEAATLARGPIDATSRLIIGAGVATAVIALAGGLVGAWRMDWLGLVMVVAGLAAAGVAWLGARAADTSDAAGSAAGRDIELGASLLAAVLGVLGLLALPFDLAWQSERGGMVGAVLTVAVAISSVALFVGAIRRWPSVGVLIVGDDRGVRIAYGGVGLVIIGWLGNATLGTWTLSDGVGVLTWVMLAGLVLRWSSDPAADGLPVAGAWTAVAFAVIATLLGIDHLMLFVGQATILGPLDWLPMLAYVAGVAMTLIGAVWTAYERTMDAQERSNIGTGDLG